MDRVRKRILRARANKHWLRVKSLFLPNVVVLSHYRSGFQWFRQICHANLGRHVVMPPQARYQHYGVERLPPRPRLDRNAILLVRDGRDVMVSLYLSSTRDGPDGTRRWEGSGEPVTFAQFLRQEFMRVRNWRGDVLEHRRPADFWSRFNADWLAHPDVVCVVRYEDLLADQAAEVRRVWRALGYPEENRAPVEIDLDFDKHSPAGANLLPGYRRRTTGNWRNVFSPEDLALFEASAGETMRRLGYATDELVAGAAAGGRAVSGPRA
ncbi:MAG TPA: sulfotransferase domain-containing protein [Candidatus Binatia bacterium]|nr:sulfotransferase domain-containing protein [Candidatus Binatia bacterium]